MMERAPLAIDALVGGNQETRGAVLRWVEAQKSQLLTDKRQDDARAQESARQAVDAQRRREALQDQHKALAAGIFPALHGDFVVKFFFDEEFVFFFMQM